MTIQVQELGIRADLFKFVDNIDTRIENKDPYLNSIDLRLKDLALDILYGIGKQDKPEVLKTLNQIKEYTGSPDLFCPEPIMKVIANLRFLMGE